ncbi:gliding motility lipoprotein GldB [Flavobacteriaceae bacterium R38]|nr:gliding motility lipoprotein GldB [Flavobacteriaceae bacterium R38]
MRIFIVLFCLIALVSCQKENKIEKEIAAIQLDVQTDRFDRKFAQVKVENLGSLKAEYPFLFPEQFPDSLWVTQIKDTLQIDLNNEVAKEFPGIEDQEIEIKSLLQHIKYYFPEKTIPGKIITVTSNVDYKNKVIYTDDFLFVSLDTYLGENHRFYDGIQGYIRKNMNKEMMASDAASAFANTIIPVLRNREFLASMIFYGKELYLKDVLIPFKTDAEKIGYTEEEYAWSEANESEIWRYFVERDLLFSTDSKLLERFIKTAPFSKFYLELDAESPGRIGRYIGWQIVRAYMDNNDVSLQELMTTPFDVIFNKSKFKPRK